MKTRIGIYPGSFDPITLGHVDIIESAFSLVDELVVAIGANPTKTAQLDVEARKQRIETVVAPLARTAAVKFKVIIFNDLLYKAARREGATILIRGLRDGTDLDYEMQLNGMNHTLAPELQTIFLPGRAEHRHISATLVRQIAALGGDVSRFVP